MFILTKPDADLLTSLLLVRAQSPGMMSYVHTNMNHTIKDSMNFEAHIHVINVNDRIKKE